MTYSGFTVLQAEDIEIAGRMYGRFVRRKVFEQWTEPRALLAVPAGVLFAILQTVAADAVERKIAFAVGGLVVLGVAGQLLASLVRLATAHYARRGLADLAGRIRRTAGGGYSLPLVADDLGLRVGSGAGAVLHRWHDFECVLVSADVLVLVGEESLALLPLSCTDLEPAVRNMVLRRVPEP